MLVGSGSVGEAEWETKVWFDGDRRCRIDQDTSDGSGWVHVEDGANVVTYTSTYGAVAKVEPRELRGPSLPELWWRPRPLISALEMGSVTEASWLGRSCWRVEARRDLARDRVMQLLLPGDEFVMWVDHDTGIVLRCLETTAGDQLSTSEWTLFEAVDDIADEVFEQAIPADVEVKTLADLAVERAREAGVDLTGVDTSDVGAIHAAIHGRRRGGLLDHHVPTGDPPADTEHAEAAIKAAYAGLSDADGDSLPNVQAGNGLAPTVRRAAERASQSDADIAVKEIRFLSDTRAAVVFTVSTSDGLPLLGGTTGEAVLHEGRWRVARSTFANLMRLAGIEPPPPH